MNRRPKEVHLEAVKLLQKQNQTTIHKHCFLSCLHFIYILTCEAVPFDPSILHRQNRSLIMLLKYDNAHGYMFFFFFLQVKGSIQSMFWGPLTFHYITKMEAVLKPYPWWHEALSARTLKLPTIGSTPMLLSVSIEKSVNNLCNFDLK